jgi:hypothetical protein
LETAELITRWTVRVALLLYFLGAAARFLPYRAGKNRLRSTARALWMLGGILYVAHVAAAFHAYHNWSHQEAFDHVAAETERMFGWRFGGGIYFNYVFGALWLIDIAHWSGRGKQSILAKWLTRTIHFFLLFIVFNGLAVFKDDGLRWFGWIGTVGVLATWALSQRVSSSRKRQEQS